MERGHVRGLDGIRAIAALLVFAEHQVWPFHWMRSGDLGVELFFVLSGYLIIGILTSRAERIESGSATKGAEILRFFAHRSFRIFPAYYALIGIFVVLAALFSQIRLDYSLFPLYLTYTTNIGFAYYFQEWPQTQNFSHFWTLAIEEQFYLLMAPIFLRLAPARHRAACLVVLAVAGAMAIALILLGMPWFTLRMDSLVNFGYLAIGGLISQTTRAAPGTRSGGVFLAAAGLAALLGFCFLTRPADGAAFAVDVAMGACSGLLIWQVVRNQKSGFVSALEVGWLRRIGKISYALYLWHIFVKLPRTGIAFEGIDLIVVANLAISLALAQASWWLIESPSLKLRDRVLPRIERWHGRRTRPASASQDQTVA